jgi:C4-dicarboxylate-specific signal transduction histidine kinase
MGQLASALAHEINQPLGAILRNAEAARIFMQDPSPDLAEITAILEDIRKDDQRAGAVIDRMRTLLRRQEVAMTELDLSQVLGDVATLVGPDAAARHVAMQLEVAPGLPPVHGDRVQLQQVLLNLILNAMDALRSEGDRHRTVAVTARREGPETLEISVADTGCGIPAAQIDRVFDPFFTTKTTGIGMGCRSRAASSRPTAAVSGRRTTPSGGHSSASPCRLPPGPDGLGTGCDGPRRA